MIIQGVWLPERAKNVTFYTGKYFLYKKEQLRRIKLSLLFSLWSLRRADPSSRGVLLWCFIVRGLETSTMRWPSPASSCCSRENEFSLRETNAMSSVNIKNNVNLYRRKTQRRFTCRSHGKSLNKTNRTVKLLQDFGQYKSLRRGNFNVTLKQQLLCIHVLVGMLGTKRQTRKVGIA